MPEPSSGAPPSRLRWPVVTLALLLPLAATAAPWLRRVWSGLPIDPNGNGYLPVLALGLLTLLGLALRGLVRLRPAWSGLLLRPREIALLAIAALAAGALASPGLSGRWSAQLLLGESLDARPALAGMREAAPPGSLLPSATELGDLVALQTALADGNHATVAHLLERHRHDRDWLADPNLARHLGGAALDEAASPALAAAVAERLAGARLASGLRRGGNATETIDGALLQAASGPLLRLLAVVLAGLAVTVGIVALVGHQWRRVERLPNPLAALPTGLADGAWWRQGGFRLGVTLVLGIWLWQLGAAGGWHPLPDLPLGRMPLIQFRGLHEVLGLQADPGGRWLLEQHFAALRLFPAVVAIGFLLMTEIGFSVWAFFIGGCLVCGWLHRFGVPVDFYLHFRKGGGCGGATLAFAAVILWLGRHHYLRLLRAACWPSIPTADRTGVWGCRLLLAGAGSLVLLQYLAGASLGAALLAVLLALAIILVVARVVAESGLVFFESASRYSEIALGLGLPALLPVTGLMLLAWLGGVLAGDTRSHPVGFLVQRPAQAETTATRGGRGRTLLLAFTMIVLVVGLLLLSACSDVLARWTAEAPGLPGAGQFEMLLQAIDIRDRPRGLLGIADARQTSILVGALLVVGLLALRRVWVGCPLHPIGLVVAGSWPVILTWGSLFLGWLVKVLVLRYGGVAAYRRLVPVAYGLLVGDLLGYGLQALLVSLQLLQGEGQPWLWEEGWAQ